MLFLRLLVGSGEMGAPLGEPLDMGRREVLDDLREWPEEKEDLVPDTKGILGDVERKERE